MKRVVAFLWVLVFICSNIVFAEDTTPRIDFSAMQWYAQATNAAAKRLGHPYTMTAADDNGSYSLAAGYISTYNQTATFEEALTSKELPVNLMISYSSISNAVAFIFGSKTISEIPLSIEAYIDGIRYQGGVLAPPEGSNPATSISGFFFDLNTVQQMMQSQDIFVRLLTDKGASFIEVSADNTLLPYCMLGLVCNGAEYCWKDSSVYLDKTRLWSEIQNWQPQEMSVQQTPEYTQPKSFQTDYEAIDQAAQSAFLLEVYDNKDQVIGTGSGFVAFDKGIMITNEHVIEDAAYIIAYSDQYRNAYKLTELKAVDKEKDIAILAFDKTANVKPLKVDGTSRLLRGQPVTAIGSPQGILNTVSSGNISNIVYYSDVVQDAIQFTAPISPGSSGGALFNEHGNVVGLCVSGITEGDLYYAIPIKYVEELYKSTQGMEVTMLMDYRKLNQIVTDPLSGLTFPIIDGWEGWVLEQTDTHYMFGMSVETEEGVNTIIYSCTDLLSEIDSVTRRKIETNQMTRNELDTKYGTRSHTARRYNIHAEKLSRMTCAGETYYGFERRYDTMPGWFAMGVRNGYMYEIYYLAPNISPILRREKTKDFLDTFVFP